MKHTLTIHTGCDTHVGFRDTITGEVSHGIRRVQVLVLSDDGKWYLQKDASVDCDGQWTAECVFGFAASAHAFQVVAIAGMVITTSPLASLPTAPVVSNIITVHRK